MTMWQRVADVMEPVKRLTPGQRRQIEQHLTVGGGISRKMGQQLLAEIDALGLMIRFFEAEAGSDWAYIEVLRKALRSNGRHLNSCAADPEASADHELCNCGLRAALNDPGIADRAPQSPPISASHV